MNYVKEERETMKKIIVMVLTVLTVIGTGLTSLAATDSAQGNLPTTGSAGAVFRAGGNTAQNGSKGRVFRPTDKTESANTSSNGSVYRPGGNSGYIGPSGSGKVYRPGGATDGSYNDMVYIAYDSEYKRDGKYIYHTNPACGGDLKKVPRSSLSSKYTHCNKPQCN